MRLPNRHQAFIAPEKVVDYLLSTAHRDGRHKASFFNKFGFTIDKCEELTDALLRHVDLYEVAKVEESPFGTRYVVDGMMTMADGRTAFVRTVWFIETLSEIPRFVTAYPTRRVIG